MKNSLILILFLSCGLLLTACGPDDDQQPAVVLFEEGDALASSDTLLVNIAIAHHPTGATDTTFFSYNASHQITAVNSPATDYTLQYDSEGRLVKMTWPQNEITYTWQVSRLIKSAWVQEGLATQYYRYKYDNSFRLMVIERYLEAEMNDLQGNIFTQFYEGGLELPSTPRSGEIARIGLASYETGSHELQGHWSYTDYHDSPSMQFLLDLMPAPDQEMQQGFSKLYPGRLFDRNIAAYRWEPAGLSNNPYTRLEYSTNSAGYVSSIEVPDKLASVDFVYQVVKKNR